MRGKLWHLAVNKSLWAGLFTAGFLSIGMAQGIRCPAFNLKYWVTSPSGGDSDGIAQYHNAEIRHRCGTEPSIQRREGGDGANLWSQLNQLPADGSHVASVKLPHIITQPLLGTAGYKTADLTPVFWGAFTPEALVVRVDSPFKTFADFLAAAKKEPGKLSVFGGQRLSPSHVAAARLDSSFGIQTQYAAFVGSPLSSLNAQAVAFTSLSQALRGAPRIRVLAIAAEQRHPRAPDAVTFREAGVNWVEGEFSGVAVPQATPAEVQKRLSDFWQAIHWSGRVPGAYETLGYFPLDIGIGNMATFMAERSKTYADALAATRAIGK